MKEVKVITEVKIKQWLIEKNNMIKRKFYQVDCETEKAYQVDGFWIPKSQVIDSRQVTIIRTNELIGCMQRFRAE